MSADKILEEYDNKKELFESCRKQTEGIISGVLKSNNLKVHKLESRVKERESLSKKIGLKSKKYNTAGDITDIVAFRIITFFEDEVDEAARIIKEEFNIDEDNSIDKRLKNSEKFGYQSLHYVFTYKDNRTSLNEYQEFKGLKCEIQIRSILQHAWAEIEHDIGYKNESGIPAHTRRNFLRTAALLETADIEFLRLRDTLYKYEEKLTQQIQSSPQSVLIDQASITIFLKTNEQLKKTEKTIEKIVGWQTTTSVSKEWVNDILTTLSFLSDVKTILDLQNKLTTYKQITLKFIKQFFSSRAHSAEVDTGISIHYTALAILLEAEDNDSIKDLLLETGFPPHHIQETLTDSIDIYSNIKSNHKAT